MKKITTQTLEKTDNTQKEELSILSKNVSRKMSMTFDKIAKALSIKPNKLLLELHDYYFTNKEIYSQKFIEEKISSYSFEGVKDLSISLDFVNFAKSENLSVNQFFLNLLVHRIETDKDFSYKLKLHKINLRANNKMVSALEENVLRSNELLQALHIQINQMQDQISTVDNLTKGVDKLSNRVERLEKNIHQLHDVLVKTNELLLTGYQRQSALIEKLSSLIE